MPVISVRVWDLERLGKVELPKDREELMKLLAVFKAELEEFDGEEVVYEAAHDRADLFSAEGLGRAIGIYLGKRDPPVFKARRGNVVLDITEAPKYRPYAFGAVVRNLDLDDEAIRQLFQLQEKLATSYGNKREIVSIGLYDLDAVDPKWYDKDRFVIKYKAVSKGSMRPLGYAEVMSFEEVLEKTQKGQEYGHLVVRGQYPVFEHDGKIMSLAPILNAEDFKVTENTKNVFIDVTGTIPEIMLRVLDVMVTSVAERSPEPIIESVKVVGFGETPRLQYKELELNNTDIEKVAGFGVDGFEKHLKKMGLIVDEGKVVVPPYRIDVFDKVDLVEDVLSSYGYQEIPREALAPTHWGSRDPFYDYLAKLMIGMGLDEVFNFVLVDEELVRELLGVDPVKLLNPRMKSFSAARPSLIPSLLLTVKQNQEKFSKIEAFEIGPIVKPEGTYWRLGVVIAGDKVTLTDVGAVLMGLKEVLDIGVELERYEGRPFITGRSAKVYINGKEAGVIGEIHPEHLVKMGIKYPTVVMEIDPELLRAPLKG